MARLTICEGPNAGKGYEFRDVCTLGRSLEATVRLQDAAVSRKHALISKKMRGYFLQDLGSGNGTLLNGALIRSEVPLKTGDKIKLGQVVLEFSEEDVRAAERVEMPAVQIIDASPTASTVLKKIDARQPAFAAALARQGAASFVQVHQRLHRVLAISNSLQRILKLDELLPRLVSDLFDILPQAQRALILLKDEHTMEFTGRVAQTREGTRLERMDVPRTIIGEVVRTRTSLLTADAMGDARFRGGESVHNLRVRSMICVPLLFENELVGVLYVDTTRPGRPFVAEDLELLTGIGAQAALAVQNAMMHERLLHRQRVESDLQFAHEVQKGFLPETPPRIPGYEFASWYSAARVVGGDFYDFIELPDDRLAIVVGDVSGKGVSAALLMAKLMSEVRYVALTEAKPTEVLRRLNEDFGRRPMEGRFVTMLYVVLDPNARRIEAVNAGHPAGLIRRRREGAIEKIEGGVNYPLGIESDTAFTSVVCELDKGDAVALFTDGVTDAMDAKGQAYGDPRLEELVRSGPEPPEQLMARILDDIGSHVGNVPPTDDLTLVCFGPTTATKK